MISRTTLGFATDAIRAGQKLTQQVRRELLELPTTGEDEPRILRFEDYKVQSTPPQTTKAVSNK